MTTTQTSVAPTLRHSWLNPATLPADDLAAIRRYEEATAGIPDTLDPVCLTVTEMHLYAAEIAGEGGSAAAGDAAVRDVLRAYLRHADQWQDAVHDLFAAVRPDNRAREDDVALYWRVERDDLNHCRQALVEAALRYLLGDWTVAS